MDLAFVFFNVGRSPFAGSKTDRFLVSENMAKSFARFAHTGDPSHPGIPTWETYDSSKRSTMVIDTEFRIKQGIDPTSIPRITLG
jgi:para-nitrobenzyl esterase